MPKRPTWSSCIDNVIKALSVDGVRVEVNHALDVSGRCHYTNEPGGPKIEINEPRAREALFVLAHEAGHLAASDVVCGYLSMAVSAREEIADSFGFLIVSGAAHRPVSWREYAKTVGLVLAKESDL